MAARFVPNSRGLSAVMRGARNGSTNASRALRNETRRLLSRSGGPSAPGSAPARRSGALQRETVARELKQMRDRILQGIKTSTPYAVIQEFGGTINAIDKSLTVPVNDRARALRESTSDLTTLDLDFRPSRSPDAVGYLFQDGELMFVLKRSVTLPARPYQRTAIRSQRTHRAVVRGYARGISDSVGRGRGAA